MSPEDIEAIAARTAELLAQHAQPRLVDASVIAAMLSVPKSWVLEQARAQRIPNVKLGTYRRFDPIAVQEWWSCKAQEEAEAA